MSKPSLKDAKLITARVTPFDNNEEIDFRKANELDAYLVDDQGSDGLVVCGTTGESPTTYPHEDIKLFASSVDMVGDRAVIIAGTGSNNTRESLKMTKEALAIGCDAVLSVIPYYNKPPQRGLLRHFMAIADVGLPVMLYNIPGRCIINLDPQTIIELAKHPMIYAIKECNIGQILEYKEEVPEDFLIYSGDDAELLNLLNLGGQGVVSVASHFIGGEIKKMINRYNDIDIKRENRLLNVDELLNYYLPFINALFKPGVPNPMLVKAGLNLQGFNVGGLRSPLVEATEEETMDLKNEMVKLNLL